MAEYGGSKEAENDGKKYNSVPQPSQDEKPTGEELAPDGGWGWMVAVGMTVIYLVCFAQGSSLGLVYGDFLIQSGYGGSALTTLNLMTMISFSFSGLICNEMLKRYNIKHVGVLGSTIYAIANTATCLMPNVPCLAILFFFQGLGLGITVTVCHMSFNAYFVKRRARVLGASHAIVGLGLIGYPFLITYFLSTFGFRGCLALLGALSFNGVASMTLMDPVEQHYKKPNILPRKDTVNEDRKIDVENMNRNLTNGTDKIDPIRRHSMDAAKSWEKNKSVLSLRAEAEHETPLLIEALKASHKSQNRSGFSIDVETGCHLRPGKESSLDRLSDRLSMTAAVSMSSITGVTPFSKIPKAEENVVEGKKKPILSILSDFFEVSLLRDGVYMNMSIGMSLVLLCDIMFASFLPMMMESRGFTKDEVALTLTVLAIAELGAKVLFTLFVMCFSVKSRHIFLGAVYILVISRIVFLYCNSLMSITVVVAVSGLARTWYMLPQSLVLVEHSKIDKFGAAWGLFAVITGVGSILVCPLVGFIRDWTQSYDITQYALIFGMLLCVVPWTIELLVWDIFSRDKTITDKPSPK